MKDSEIRSKFDGRGRVEVKLHGLEVSDYGRVNALAYVHGYDVVAAEMISRSTYRMLFVRNDSPEVRARVEQANINARQPGPLPTDYPGQHPRPFHAWGTWVTPGEVAEAKLNTQLTRVNTVAPLWMVPGAIAIGLVVAAWYNRHDSGAVLVLGYLAAIFVFAAIGLPILTLRRRSRDQAVLEQYRRQQAENVQPPPPPPSIPPNNPTGPPDSD